APLSRRWLSVDAWLLGLRCRRRRLLLGAGHLGHGSGTWTALDSGLLGLGRQRIRFLQRLLGPAGWFLRRRQLRLWILRRWLSGWTLAGRTVLLQPFSEQCECHQHSQRLQHD